MAPPRAGGCNTSNRHHVQRNHGEIPKTNFLAGLIGVLSQFRRGVHGDRERGEHVKRGDLMRVQESLTDWRSILLKIDASQYRTRHHQVLVAGILLLEVCTMSMARSKTELLVDRSQPSTHTFQVIGPPSEALNILASAQVSLKLCRDDEVRLLFLYMVCQPLPPQ